MNLNNDRSVQLDHVDIKNNNSVCDSFFYFFEEEKKRIIVVFLNELL